MSSPRKINRKLNHGYIIEIMKLCQNINLYAVSLLVDYSHLFSEEEKRNINNYIDKIELYIELLKGFKQLLIKGECHSSIHKKFKVIAQEIFEIENLLKKYSIKVWKNELTDVKKFRNGNNYCFSVHSLLIDPNLRFENDEQLKYDKYEERMNMLQNKDRRFLSTSLVSGQLTRLFNESHIAAIMNVDESNYIGACCKDAGTGDSMFAINLMCPGNYDDIYILRRDEEGNIYTREPATLVSTPKIIKFNQLYDDSTVTISEIILDRMKSKTEGILCYVYGNEFLSYSRKFAEKLGTKFNLPVLYIDKMLYKGENISEYEVYEKFEIVDGIRQFLNNDVQKNIYDLSKWQYDIEEETYLNIFREVCKENPKSTVEAKRIVERIARKILQQNELER